MKHELHYQFFSWWLWGFPNFLDGLSFSVLLDNGQRSSQNYSSNAKQI